MRSIRIAPVSWSNAENTSAVNLRRAAGVEKLGLKPDWDGDKILV